LQRICNKHKVKFCSNPEFLREGSAWRDFINPDKIIIGAEDNEVKKILLIIYKNFTGKKIITNFNTAEFIKILSNNLLSNLISFSNFLSLIAYKIGNINIKYSFDAVKIDSRWFGNPAGISSYFHPSLGYGGACLPKDTEVLAKYSAKYFNKNNIITENFRINRKITKFYANYILEKSKNYKYICILGISFKSGSDDMRNSKSIELIKILKKKTNKKIKLYDPIVKKFLNSKILSSPSFNKNCFYVLANPDYSYINFLKKKNKNNYIDLRYIV
jgi:UDPglucose 6-dehydrogenase